jgi:protoheme ferro-lyase
MCKKQSKKKKKQKQQIRIKLNQYQNQKKYIHAQTKHIKMSIYTIP